MRLPWVSRDAFDGLAEQHRKLHELFSSVAKSYHAMNAQTEGHVVRILENHATEAERAEKRFADLMASYRMLKLQGATEAAPPIVREIKPPDPVEAAIRAACAGKGTEVYRQQRAAAAAARAQGATDEQIIANTQRGSRPAEEMAS